MEEKSAIEITNQSITLWNTIIPAVAALFGVFISSIANHYTNKKLIKNTIDLEDRNYHRELKIDKLMLYSDFLMANYIAPVLTVDRGDDKFDVKIYQSKLRPILYKKYYLVDEEVKTDLKTIDGNLLMYEITGDWPDFDDSLFVENYRSILCFLEDQCKNTKLM